MRHVTSGVQVRLQCLGEMEFYGFRFSPKLNSVVMVLELDKTQQVTLNPKELLLRAKQKTGEPYDSPIYPQTPKSSSYRGLNTQNRVLGYMII